MKLYAAAPSFSLKKKESLSCALFHSLGKPLNPPPPPGPRGKSPLSEEHRFQLAAVMAHVVGEVDEMHLSASAGDGGRGSRRSRAMLFGLDKVILMSINYNLFHSCVFILITSESILSTKAGRAGDGSNSCRGPAGPFERLPLCPTLIAWIESEAEVVGYQLCSLFPLSGLHLLIRRRRRMGGHRAGPPP